jgi:hypothetical protein
VAERTSLQCKVQNENCEVKKDRERTTSTKFPRQARKEEFLHIFSLASFAPLRESVKKESIFIILHFAIFNLQ